MQTQEISMRVINYKRMRLVIGLIAFLMPIAVWLLSGHPGLSSISISYWTHSQDIFVGSLFAVGFFMMAYKTEDQGVPAGATKLKKIPNLNPSKRDFSTGIEVEVDAEYFFLAEGCWQDWFIRCGPNGWGPKWKAFTYKNRIKGQPFFILYGNVGKSNDEDLVFCIGDKYRWSVPEKVKQLENRELYLFANDWPTDSAYKNNKELEPDQGGPLKVTIYRLKKTISRTSYLGQTGSGTSHGEICT